MATESPGRGSACSSEGEFRFPLTRKTATSLRTSKATACARSGGADALSTTVSRWPATTWAFVTTRPLSRDPAGAGDAEAAGGSVHADDARRRLPDARLAEHGRIRWSDRRQRTGDRRERINARESSQRSPRRHELVQLAEHRGLLHLPPEVRLAGKLERDRAEDPDQGQPGERTEREAAGRVGGAEWSRRNPPPDRRPDRRAEELQQDREPGGADERDERRVGRLRAVGEQVRREPGADERARRSPRRRTAR